MYLLVRGLWGLKHINEVCACAWAVEQPAVLGWAEQPFPSQRASAPHLAHTHCMRSMGDFAHTAPPPLHAGANRTAHLQDVGLCLLPCGARVLVLWASVFAECHLTSICVGNIAVLFLKKDNNTGWSTTLVGVCLCVMGDAENLKAVVCAFDGLLGRWWKMTVKYIKWMNKISKQV